MQNFFLRLAIAGAVITTLAGAFTGCSPTAVKSDPDKLKAESEDLRKNLQKEHENPR